MAGSVDDRSRARQQKEKFGLRSLFKSKNKSAKTEEQSSLPQIPKESSSTQRRKVDEAGAPNQDQPATNSTDLSQTGAVDKASATLSSVSVQPKQSPKPIRELWNEAYEDLKAKEESLMKDYEAAMSKDMTTILSSTTLALAGPQIPVLRKEQMTALVEKKTAEARENAWKLRYGDNEVLLKDLAGPVVSVIQDAEAFVNGAVSANPYASIAWAGVSLLLPLFLNPSKQAASLATGLSYIGNLIVRSDMRQKLYERQYETNSSDKLHEYRDTLKELYSRILKFEAKIVCYYSKNEASRLGRDVVKWDKWDSMLQDVTVQEGAFLQVYDIWKDLIAREEYDKLSSRHSESMEIMTLISENIVGFRQAVASAQSDENRAKLIAWLSSANPSINYISAREKHQPKTGDWLVKESPGFENWKTSPNSFLWVNGKAGSGKTILSSSVIKHLKNSYGENPQIALAYFYFRFDDLDKPNTMALARSLIKQLYCCQPNTPEAVEALRKYRENGQNPEPDNLRDALIATIRGFSSVYIVLDALDEYSLEVSERKKLLDFIRQLQSSGLTNLHVLCTSRREVDIEKAFKNLFSASMPANVDIDLLTYRYKVDHDIGLHIDKTLASETYDEWPEVLKKEVREALVEKADGMFQYISCQFDTLRDLPGPRAIREALKNLPDGLDATYDRILQSIKPKFRRPVSNVLKWLSFSLRPLIVEEIAEIFILDHDRKPPFDELDRLSQPEIVLNYLPSLVTKVTVKRDGYEWRETLRYDEKVIEIKLAHFSIKEYLMSPRIVQSPAKNFFMTEKDAHLHISEACLAYHLHLSLSILATAEECKRFALWEYVGRYWLDHLERVPRASWTSLVTGMAVQALSPNSPNLLNMNRIAYPSYSWVRPRWSVSLEDLASPLYYTAGHGATQLIELLLDTGVDINEHSARNDGVALIIAISKGHINVLKLLLDRGAKLNTIEGSLYGNALQTAVCTGSKNVVHFFLERGVDINAQGGYFGSALQGAAFRGNTDIMQLLLDRAADINAHGGKFGNALQAAIVKDNIQCAELLVSRGARVDSPGPQWEEFMRKISVIHGERIVNNLREFQEDPSGYIAARRRPHNA